MGFKIIYKHDIGNNDIDEINKTVWWYDISNIAYDEYKKYLGNHNGDFGEEVVDNNLIDRIATY